MTSPTSSATGTQSAAQTASGSPLGGGTSASDLQSTFLQLLVTQLQNQDPTNPMDSSAMTSQLAQINTVSGISQLNTTLSSLSSQLSAGQNAQLIGQSVLAPGNTTTVSSGTSTGFGVSLPTNVSDLQVQVTDKSGNVVTTLDFGAQQAGNFPLAWTPDSSVADGTYTFTAVGTTSTGTSAETTLSLQKVAGVAQSNGNWNLVLQDGSSVPESSVSMIL